MTKEEKNQILLDANLSEYQRTTALKVLETFEGGKRAYLVADEVGLGKTYVAKGVIKALAAEKEKKDKAPFRVLYIASNPQVAEQNTREEKLGGPRVETVTDLLAEKGKSAEDKPAKGKPAEVTISRLSMLGYGVQLPESPKIQVYALSPRTTFVGKMSPRGNHNERERMIKYLEKKKEKDEIQSALHKILTKLYSKDNADASEKLTKFDQVLQDNLKRNIIFELRKYPEKQGKDQSEKLLKAEETLQSDLGKDIASVLRKYHDELTKEQKAKTEDSEKLFEGLKQDTVGELCKYLEAFDRLLNGQLTKAGQALRDELVAIVGRALLKNMEKSGNTDHSAEQSEIQKALQKLAKSVVSGPRKDLEMLKSAEQMAEMSGSELVQLEYRVRTLVSALRNLLCEEAVRAMKPDLIILDEFHRFKEILRGDTDQVIYSFHDMLEVLEEETKQPAKILLLSATPYQYIEGAETTLHQYAEDGDAVVTEGTESPYANFETLKKQLCKLSDLTAEEIQTPDDYYNNLLCRTQRNWLMKEPVPAGGQQAEQADPRSKWPTLLEHLAYCAGYMQRLGTSAVSPETTQEENSADEMMQAVNSAVQKLREKTMPVKLALQKTGQTPEDALGSAGGIRSYLDEAPEYLQFSEGYRSAFPAVTFEKTSTQDGDSAKQEAKITRDTFCDLLRKSPYLLKRNGDGSEYDALGLEGLKGHFKWERLREVAMPQGSELRLWVPPTLHSYEEAFGKTVVFAHYRVSTRAIAALTSMEAQRRLMERIGGRDILPQGKLDQNIVKELLQPVYAAYATDVAEEKKTELWEAVETFFNTTHARRVLTAYAQSKQDLANCDLSRVVEQYCLDYRWDAMLREYTAVLNGLSPKRPTPKKQNEQLQELIGVMNWTDQDATRILVLPDWSDQGYPCTFGERLTPDYSDKAAHDEQSDAAGRGKRNTAKREEYIRNRFQSPFYPFVLAAAETAQEGVDLHNYAATAIHWSMPSNLNAFIQKEGRVKRRASLTLRRQAVWMWKNARPTKDKPLESVTVPFSEADKLYGKSAPKNHGGLFPYWVMPVPADVVDAKDCPRLTTEFLILPLSNEEDERKKLLQMQSAYAGFGLKKEDTGIAGSEDEIKQALCPYLRAQKHQT